jgi:2-polyprenyl-6-methoxyphenol hydroxylase-like FAD-dependent oxidoreductase
MRVQDTQRLERGKSSCQNHVTKLSDPISHGYGPVIFHRAQLIEAIYKSLPDLAKLKVLTNKKLDHIESHDDGVKVTCADGTVYQGSMVIGADGVNSKTRQLMREIALKEDPFRDWDPENPYKSTFRVLFGAFPPASPPGQGYDVQSSGKSAMYFSGTEHSWFFLYDKLPKPTNERTCYTEKEVEMLAGEFAEFPLGRNLKVKDVWPNMLAAGLTDLQEGIVKHWSLGRIVLVGDSCHKFTTHLGLGFNNGVQDVVVLCNGLRATLERVPQHNPDNATLTGVFEEYEALRKSPDSSLIADLANSALETRMHTWSNTFYWLFFSIYCCSSIYRKLVSSVWAFSTVPEGASFGLCDSTRSHDRKVALATLDGKEDIIRIPPLFHNC